MKDVRELMRGPLDKRGIINNASLVNEQIRALEDAGYRLAHPDKVTEEMRNAVMKMPYEDDPGQEIAAAIRSIPRITEEGK